MEMNYITKDKQLFESIFLLWTEKRVQIGFSNCVDVIERRKGGR